MNYLSAINRLSAAPGPSGFEGAVTRVALDMLRPLVPQAHIDRMGNVVGLRPCGKPGAKKVLLDAHLDEIGFIITGQEEGYLRFAPLGGVDPRMLPDRELTVLTDPPRLGVVACLPPHIQSREDMDKSQPISELYLDLGLTEEEAKAIPIGTPAVYRTGCLALGKDLLSGKALDDRACFVLLLRALELLEGEELDVDLIVLGSTQEETHSTGAITAAYGLQPDLCVAVDVTHGDSPDASKDKTFPLGKGPVIGLGPNCTKWISDLMRRCAKDIDLSVQLEVMSGSSGTNGWPLQVSREGIATGVLSLPLRYMHTPIETAHQGDMEDTARLLAQFVRRVGKEGAL